MVKYLEVEMPDGTVWRVPAERVAFERAAYYADGDAGREGLSLVQRQAVYNDEVKVGLGDPDELIDWAKGNMDWKDVRGEAVFHRTAAREATDYGTAWSNAPMRVVEVP